jgi:hypothetical protein
VRRRPAVVRQRFVLAQQCVDGLRKRILGITALLDSACGILWKRVLATTAYYTSYKLGSTKYLLFVVAQGATFSHATPRLTCDSK